MSIRRKPECHRLRQLLELILSLPFLAVNKRRAIVITEDTIWSNMRQEIQNNPEAKALFIKAADSLGIKSSIADMDASTAKLVLETMITIDKKRSKADLFD